MSTKEMVEKRKRGLCFWCDDKFTPGYRCQKKQLYMLTIGNEDIEVDESVEEVQGNEQLFLEPQLSIHAITSVYSYQTLRIRGYKGTKPLFLFIDSRSTQNFLIVEWQNHWGVCWNLLQL